MPASSKSDTDSTPPSDEGDTGADEYERKRYTAPGEGYNESVLAGSAPDPSPNVDAEGGARQPGDGPGYDTTPPGCNCGEYHFTLSDGRTVHRASRKPFCPVHGLNRPYRRSFSAHAAWVCRRSSYRRCDLYHITATLHAEDVERLGLTVGDTRAVLSQLLPRLRKRLDRKDADAEALLSMAPRPKSGEYHLHVLMLSKGCTLDDVRSAFTLDGTDVHVTTPESRWRRRRDNGHHEAPMSAERFAAAMGSYLFDNRVHGALQEAETRFSSWGKGVGYYSVRARERRQRYAKQMSDAGGDSAPAPDGSSTKNPTPGGSSDDETGGETPDDGRQTPQAPPVELAAGDVSTADEARRAVLKGLMARLHTAIPVRGVGRCKLTWVEVGDEGSILCYVRPLELHSDKQRVLVWRKVVCTGTPSIDPRTKTDSDMSDTADEPADEPAEGAADNGAADDGPDDGDKDTPDEGAWGASMAEKYLKNARHQKSSVPTGDGRRRVVEKVDGEVVRDEIVEG